MRACSGYAIRRGPVTIAFRCGRAQVLLEELARDAGIATGPHFPMAKVKVAQAHGLRPEDALLFCCARTCVGNEVERRVYGLFDQKVDWTYLIQRAIHHRVVPLVYQTLRQHFPDRVPAAAMADLQHVHGIVVRQNLFLLTKLVRLMSVLDENAITAIPFKGPALAVLAYGNFGLRQFGDLDILVHPDDFLRTRDLLLDRGYRVASQRTWECSLIDAADGVTVDLHQAITPRSFPVSFDFHAFQQHLQAIPVAGKTIQTFGPEDMLIVLCVQLAKDGWGTNVLRLIKICDIAELLRMHPDMDWDRVLGEATRLGCRDIVSFALSFSRELLGAPVPTLALQPIPARHYTALSDHIMDKLVHQQGPGYAGLIGSGNRFHFKIRERWTDKLYPYLYDFRAAVRPSDTDREFFRLPASLEPLYYAVRPIRVLRDFVRRRRDSGAESRPDSSNQ